MLTLLKWTLLVAAIAAVLAFVPVNGRTLVDRWRKSRDTSEFVHGLWIEGRHAFSSAPTRSTSRHPSAPAARAAPHARTSTRSAARPAEQHSEADRAAIDRILTEHAN
jgi:hypothetical protein